MGNKDYYAILGVNQVASDDDIKRAYKQQALKHHPDKNRGDIDAEKKFMDISEAYEILSDPYKRSLYDRVGSEELRNYLGTDANTSYRPSGTYYSDIGGDSNQEYTYDPFNNYFVRYKDPSTFYDLYVSLEEINKGATKKMKVTRKRYNTELNTTVRDEKLLEIQIKPGWKEGTKITFEGEGDEADLNTIAGDIVFIIRDKPHPVFERSNSDLIYRVKLSLKQALLGTLITIPFLDSTKQPYQFRSNQEIVTPQTEKRFPNEGLPYPKDPTRRGDLIVKFDILFPKVLNQEQRTLVDCCFTSSIDSYQPTNSVLHTTIIDPTLQQPTTSNPTVSPTNKSQSTSNPTVSPTTKTQTVPPNTTNSQQKASTRQMNGNGRQKSPISPNKNPTKTKISTARTNTTVIPPAPPSSPTSLLNKETLF